MLSETSKTKKLKITMDAYVELEDDESIVHFVAKVLKGGGPGPLREVRMKVPEYSTKELDVLRKCIDCGKEAMDKDDLENFMKRKSAPHGRGNLCKDCRNARTRLGGRRPS